MMVISLIVNVQRDIEFINACCCIVDYKELDNAILWYQEKPTYHKKKIYLHGSYPCVSIYDKKIHVHRLLMMYWLGRKLKTNEHVHHRNGNKLDNSRDNLVIINASKHLSKHNKGKIFTKEHRQKISEENKKRKGQKMKKRRNIPLIELGDFLQKGKSINWIANYYKVDWTTIKNRINENPELSEVRK